jgi:hypothetical protein
VAGLETIETDDLVENFEPSALRTRSPPQNTVPLVSARPRMIEMAKTGNDDRHGWCRKKKEEAY